MVLISRTPQGRSGRHHVGRFDFTEAERSPPPPKPAPTIAAPERPVRTVVITPPPRKSYTRREPVVPKPTPTSKPIELDSAQRESILEGLDVRAHLIGRDMMVEVKSLVEGTITGLSIKPTQIERNIFHLLQIPGF